MLFSHLPSGGLLNVVWINFYISLSEYKPVTNKIPQGCSSAGMIGKRYSLKCDGICLSVVDMLCLGRREDISRTQSHKK